MQMSNQFDLFFSADKKREEVELFVGGIPADTSISK
jgi:hypothetical protein